jgi:hypothetical protein
LKHGEIAMPMMPYASLGRTQSRQPAQPTGLQQLQEMMQLNADMRAGRTPRAQRYGAANAYAGGINAARNEVQASGAVGRPGMGLVTNAGAQDIYSRSGGQYMPTMTVGGAWGQPTPGMAGVVTPTQERNQIRMGQVNSRLARQAQPAPGVNPQTLMRGQQAMQGMQAAGVGQIDPATGAFVGNSALGLLGDARGQRVAGMLGRGPSYQAPSESVLAENAEAYGARRAGAMAERQQGVRERGKINAEARRVRMGNLTFDERLLARQPGLGIAREQAGAARDVAGIGANAQKEIAGLVREVDMARIDADKAIATGNQQAIVKAQRRQARAEQRLAETKGASEEKIAGINAGPATTAANAAAESAKTQREDVLLRRAEQYREAADNASRNGDYEGYQRNNAMADQIIGQIQPGLPTAGGPPAPGAGLPGINQPQAGVTGANTPQSWSQVPQSMRQQIVAGGPEAAVANIRLMFPGMPQDAVDAMIQEAFPGTGVTSYNPDGFGLSDAFGTITGWENVNRWRGAAGNGPQPPVPFQLPGVPGLIQNWLGY